MKNTAAWAKSRWMQDLRGKLEKGSIGSKQWWGLTKNMQGLTREDLIPPLQSENGIIATTSKAKAEVLAYTS